jgi:hypothetical protein
MSAIPWTETEAEHLRAEREGVAALAPELRWSEGLRAFGRKDLVGFTGPLPAWCAERPMPAGVLELLGTDRLEISCVYSEATPMVPPAIYPVTPRVPLVRRTDHTWHVNGDGSLCLLQTAGDWRPGETAVPLLIKASCWFVEYRLKEAELIESMSEHGIAVDTRYDAILAGARA